MTFLDPFCVVECWEPCGMLRAARKLIFLGWRHFANFSFNKAYGFRVMLNLYTISDDWQTRPSLIKSDRARVFQLCEFIENCRIRIKKENATTVFSKNSRFVCSVLKQSFGDTFRRHTTRPIQYTSSIQCCSRKHGARC